MDNFFTIAAMAPREIPDWFKHEPAPDKPEKPTFKENTPINIKFAINEWLKGNRPGPTEEDMKIDMSAGYLPPFFDYKKQLSKWVIKDEEARYFQWQIYYAQKIRFYDTLQNKDKNERDTVSSESNQRLLNATKYALDCLFRIKMDQSYTAPWADLAYQALQEAFINITSPHNERRP